MVQQDVEWAAKYKIRGNAFVQRSTRGTIATDNDSDAGILPCGWPIRDNATSINAFVDMLQCNVCTPISFKSFPFLVPQKSCKCQLWHCEMCHDKWKGVVLCSHHGVRLCSESHPSRCASSPMLLQDYGEEVTDFSWICEEKGSCWNKFHNFYMDQGLFGPTKINLNEKRLCFAGVKYTSEIHQKKYAAFGI